jgi:hypothetical protein
MSKGVGVGGGVVVDDTSGRGSTSFRGHANSMILHNRKARFYKSMPIVEVKLERTENGAERNHVSFLCFTLLCTAFEQSEVFERPNNTMRVSA